MSASNPAPARQLDPVVAAVLDKHEDEKAKHGLDSDDDEALFEELERDEDLSGLREKRMQELHEELARAKAMRNEGFGQYTEASTEKEVLDFTTATKYSIVHFYHPDFRRCKIMDVHLEKLAEKHFDTKIARIDVQKAPFLVERLKVRILPCVMSFIDGKQVNKLEGFELLGNTDDFSIGALENELIRCGVFQRAKVTDKTTVRGISSNQTNDDDDDDDWD